MNNADKNFMHTKPVSMPGSPLFVSAITFDGRFTPLQIRCETGDTCETVATAVEHMLNHLDPLDPNIVTLLPYDTDKRHYGDHKPIDTEKNKNV